MWNCHHHHSHLKDIASRNVYEKEQLNWLTLTNDNLLRLLIGNNHFLPHKISERTYLSKVCDLHVSFYGVSARQNRFLKQILFPAITGYHSFHIRQQNVCLVHWCHSGGVQYPISGSHYVHIRPLLQRSNAKCILLDSKLHRSSPSCLRQILPATIPTDLAIYRRRSSVFIRALHIYIYIYTYIHIYVNASSKN